MKRTVNVNIGSMAFTVDEDAYAVLKEYLDDVASRLGVDERQEVVDDIEGRIAEIFRERLSVVGQVVGLQLVHQAIAVIGRADCFGERCGPQPHTQPSFGDPSASQAPRRLYRSWGHRMIAGVCAGVAEYMNWDPTLVRVGAVLLVACAGLSLWVYIGLWILIPNAPYEGRKNDRP